MPKESINISSILVKDEKIELFIIVKEEIIKLPNNWKEETKELQNKVKENIVLHIMKEETLELPKIKNCQEEHNCIN
jgi:iron-sulfur cluster repair protein YtfE (RIC family)